MGEFLEHWSDRRLFELWYMGSLAATPCVYVQGYEKMVRDMQITKTVKRLSEKKNDIN